MISFTVEGNPVPKERVRVVKHGKRNLAYTKPRTKAWQAHVAWTAKQVAPEKLIKGPVAVVIDYFLGDLRRKDLDNLNKAIFDALNGVIWEDDQQIVQEHIYKKYDKAEPRVEIMIGQPGDFVLLI